MSGGLRTHDPKVNRFPGLMVEHFYVTFVDPSCIGFIIDIVLKIDRHINASENVTVATAIGVDNKTVSSVSSTCTFDRRVTPVSVADTEHGSDGRAVVELATFQTPVGDGSQVRIAVRSDRNVRTVAGRCRRNERHHRTAIHRCNTGVIYF